VDTHTELLGQMGEIALHARSRDEYWAAALACLARAVGAEGGSISGFWGAASTYDGHHVVAGVPLDRNTAMAYLGEFSREEKARGLQGPAWQDSEVIRAGRRDRLSLYREYFRDLGVRTFAARGWSDASGVHLVTLISQGAVDSARFGRRAKTGLDAVFPLMALAERLFASASPPPATNPGERWAASRGVTPSELKVISLVERGLTNPEIAAVLALSPNTVRNRLATAFRKLEVTRRAELAYQLGIARESARQR
jgi:DNA-binding CsgD family transcriptional regulator